MRLDFETKMKLAQTILSELANGGLTGAPAYWSAPVLWRFSRAGRKAAEGCRSPKPRGISSAAAGSPGARVCDPQQLRKTEGVRINVSGLDNLGIAAGHRPALHPEARN